MARRVYTDKQKTEALRLYEVEGLSAAHKQTGIPKTTIQSWAKKAGVRTSATENVRAANEAQSESFKARRQRITDRLYGLAESTLDVLENPDEYQTIMRGEMGAEVVRRPGFIPAQDKKNEATSLGIVLDKAEGLEKFDNDNGATEAKGLLVALAEQIGVGSE